MAIIKEFWIYPIKGCRGIQVPFLPITPLGPHLDRHWVLVDENSRFITQREEPRLAQIELSLPNSSWGVQCNEVKVKVEKDLFDLRLEMDATDPLKELTLWGQTLKAVPVADDLAKRISDFLQRKVTVMQVHQDTQRAVSKKYQNFDSQVAFADGYPFLVVFSASLNDLNSRLEQKIDHSRFRANILIDNNGEEPFMEDQLQFVTLGKNQFSVKPCSRCIVINTDQMTGERQKSGEPLKVLAKYRNQGGKVNFGINLVHQTTGILQLDDRVNY